jgi:hypothetical protein
MCTVRTSFLSLAALLVFLITVAPPARAYSVLTHEQIIDLTWTDSIQPLLLQRFPTLTPAELREAHAYAYGGCLIQDLGYYPFGKPNFSDLLHYVRSGDFVRALFHESKTPDDFAFSIGALSHYLGDTIGHPDAINLAVGQEFPELAQKYGKNVNYAEAPHQHVRAEFAFDIEEITKHRMAPERYLNRIGFAVPVPLLTRAFYDTYGLDMAKVLQKSHPNLSGYRYSVRTLLPSVAYAETLLHGSHFAPDVSSPALDTLNQDVAHLSAANNWPAYRSHPGFGTHLLAGFIVILPKVGPLSGLKIKVPSPAAKQHYLDSLVKTTALMREILAHATKSDRLPNLDLDTGLGVSPGTYSLEDYTYADLLHAVTSTPETPVPFGIKHDLLAYFSDLDKVVYLKQKPKLLAQVQADLPILRTISTKAAYPESAFLPQPESAKAPDAKDSLPEPKSTAAGQATDPTKAPPPSDSKPVRKDVPADAAAPNTGPSPTTTASPTRNPSPTTAPATTTSSTPPSAASPSPRSPAPLVPEPTATSPATSGTAAPK